MTKLAIVTVDYNNHSDTRDFLESRKRLDVSGFDLLWLVVDNGSDKSVDETLREFPGVVWLQSGLNSGFAGGFNKALKYAYEWGAEKILIINNDTLFGERNLLTKLSKVLDKHNKIAAVSPKIYFAPDFEYYSNKYRKEDRGKVIWYAGGKFDWDNIRSVHRGIDEVDSGGFGTTEQTGFVSGCCVMLKREVLEQVGYFDEKLFAYYEDADWIERVTRAGRQIWYCGNTFIYHKVSQTSGIGSEYSDFLITRNRMWFGMRWAKFRTRMALTREAVKFLLIGRPAQKKGILAYLDNDWSNKNISNTDRDYPFLLSVVIINYRTTSLTLQLLKSIYKEKMHDIEVIVLDNSPEDSCGAQVKKHYPSVKFIQNAVNNGFPKANNQMIDYALGKYILMLNSDIEVCPGSIKIMLKTAEKLGEKAIYTGRLKFPDGTVQDSCFRLPNAKRAFEEYFLGKKGSYFMYQPAGKGPVKVDGAVMACFMIPRVVINNIGKLEEETFMYFEDIDYCRRAKKFGVPIYYIPEAEFIHYHGQASKKAGVNLSNARLVQAAKWYHGKFNYYLLTAVLWLGQKYGKTKTPVSKWQAETD